MCWNAQLKPLHAYYYLLSNRSVLIVCRLSSAYKPHSQRPEAINKPNCQAKSQIKINPVFRVWWCYYAYFQYCSSYVVSTVWIRVCERLGSLNIIFPNTNLKLQLASDSFSVVCLLGSSDELCVSLMDLCWSFIGDVLRYEVIYTSSACMCVIWRGCEAHRNRVVSIYRQLCSGNKWIRSMQGFISFGMWWSCRRIGGLPVASVIRVAQQLLVEHVMMTSTLIVYLLLLYSQSRKHIEYGLSCLICWLKWCIECNEDNIHNSRLRTERMHSTYQGSSNIQRRFVCVCLLQSVMFDPFMWYLKSSRQLAVFVPTQRKGIYNILWCCSVDISFICEFIE